MASSRSASRSAAYAASWSPSAGKNQGESFPADPAYPTVTGTEEFKLEGDALGSGEIDSWIDDFNSYDFTAVADASIAVGSGVFADEKHAAFDGTQGDSPFVDRGSALSLPSGITTFFVIETGAISGASAHSTMAQFNRGPTLSRMSFVARRNAAGNFMSWWDVGGVWLESSTELADNTKYVISFRSNNTSMKVAVNGGAEEGIGNPVHQQIEMYNIGNQSSNTEPFIGNIAAAIFYRSELSDADRILVRDYLNLKYIVY